MTAINDHIFRLGIIGWPVSHSLSPAMHNGAAADVGIELEYLKIPVQSEELASILEELPAKGFRGVNVTVPHKESVVPLLDVVDDAARIIGAVNTIVIERKWIRGGALPKDRQGASQQLDVRPADGDQVSGDAPHPILAGYNTDWSGFLADLESLNVNTKGGDCLILGAGGSARAVAYGLAISGNRVRVFSRRKEQAYQLAAEIGQSKNGGQISGHPWSSLGEDIDLSVRDHAVTLIVNTTPLGMTPNTNSNPWPVGLKFPDNCFVYDLVYNPAETRFLHQAKSAGCRTANGLGMLVHQGAESFRLWTGKEPNLQIMVDSIS